MEYVKPISGHIRSLYPVGLQVIAILFFIGCTNKKESLPQKPVVKIETGIKTAPKPYDSIITNEFYHDELSKSFDIKVLINRYVKEKQSDSCIAKITLLDKVTKKAIDSFSITSGIYYGVFEDKNSVRSYSTKFNATKEAVDNDYGDIVVADFNSDNKEDVAIVRDMGGSSGNFYNFYIQQENKKFKMDRFLSDSMVYFPDQIGHNQLRTGVVGGVCYLGRHTYTLDKKTNTWKETSHITIDVCKNKVVKESE